MDQKLSLEQRLKVPQMVAVAMMGSCLMQLYLAYVAQHSRSAEQTFPASLTHPFLPVFSPVAALSLLAAIFIPALIQKREVGQAPLSDADRLRRAFTPLIVRLCLLETISILGFVIGQQSADLNVSYLATGIALAGMALSFPTRDRMMGSSLFSGAERSPK